MELHTLLAMRPAEGHEAPVAPLTGASGWVLVDGHAICAVCGRAAEPVTPTRWRHAPDGARPLGDSPLLAPITPDALVDIDDYTTFGERFPWAVRPDFASPVVTSPDEWLEGTARLAAFTALLDTYRDRTTIAGGANPLLEGFRILTRHPVGGVGHADAAPAALPPGLAQMLGLAQRRRELAVRFAWAVPDDAALELMGRCEPLLDAGAGTGYWAALLTERGVDIVASDLRPPGPDADNTFHPGDHPPWTTVLEASSVVAARRHPDRSLVLCWPPHEDDAAGFAAIRAYAGDTVIHIGDPDAGSGSIRLHRELTVNWSVTDELMLPQWPRIADRVTVYRRNPVRRPLTARNRCYQCGRFVDTTAIGRCDSCFTRDPPALAIAAGRHRVEYPPQALRSMPAALRWALAGSPNRIS